MRRAALPAALVAAGALGAVARGVSATAAGTSRRRPHWWLRSSGSSRPASCSASAGDEPARRGGISSGCASDDHACAARTAAHGPPRPRAQESRAGHPRGGRQCPLEPRRRRRRPGAGEHRRSSAPAGQARRRPPQARRTPVRRRSRPIGSRSPPTIVHGGGRGQTTPTPPPHSDRREMRVLTPEIPWRVGEVAWVIATIFLAVMNLVANAVKFSPPGATIEVRALEEDRHAVIEVADTGIGIPDDEIDLVWEELAQGRGVASGPRQRHRPGAGPDDRRPPRRIGVRPQPRRLGHRRAAALPAGGRVAPMSPICDDVGITVRQRVRTMRGAPHPRGAPVNRTRLTLTALTTAILAAACGRGSKDNDDASGESTVAATWSVSTTPETSATASPETSPETTDAPTTETTAPRRRPLPPRRRPCRRAVPTASTASGRSARSPRRTPRSQ